MKTPTFVLACACLLAPAAQAQQLSDPFAEVGSGKPRAYLENVAPEPQDRLYRDTRRDPQLIGGIEVAPNLAIEAGYLNLPDRELYKVDPGTPDSAAIGLGERGSSNHVAAKVSLPLEGRLEAHGKAGVAHSTLKARGATPQRSDTGVYLGAGARYRIDRATTLDGQFVRHGDAASKIGTAVKDGVKANLKVGF